MRVAFPPSSVLALLATVPACAQAAPEVQSVRDREAQARVRSAGTSIFDGRTLDGWEGDPRYWSVEDGAIVGRTTAADPLRRTTYLIWRGGEVRDFELELEFRFAGTPKSHPKANSGIQFRGRELGRFSIAGYQADLAYEPGLTGTLYEQFGSRQLMARLGEHVTFASDGTRTLSRFVEESAFDVEPDPNGWRRMKIRAVGAAIELFVDGDRTVKVEDRHRLFASTSGKLALQLHSGPAQEVRFRNLELTDLGGKLDRRPRVDPQWIWSSYEPRDGEEAWFRREFVVAGEVQRALLWGMADDALEVYLNGELIASAEGYERMLIVEPLAVRQGANVLAAWVRNDKQDAGLFLSLRLRQPSGLTTIDTAPEFFATNVEVPGWNRVALGEPGTSAAPWRSAVSFGPLGTEPWGVAPGMLVNPKVHALAGEEVEVPAGFRTELVYSVPRARQGSWVALTFDGKGRAIASDENGALYRVDLSSGEPQVVQLPVSETIDIGEAQGLLYAFDALYVSVSRSRNYASGLYRLRDTNGDDRYDELELLRAFEGEGEHGPHAILKGPDDKLYLFAGDEVALPEDARASFGASLLPAGLLPPRIFMPEGRAGELVRAGRAGWVVRTDPDGRDFELFVYGLRNAYDGAFDAEGELFTFDSDMEWDLGLPWYRAARFYHLVHGGDYGARYGTGKWPYHFEDTLPPALEVGRASPTGMLSGHELSFGERYGDALFAGDWLNGTILAFFPEAHGSSYRGRVEVFARGEPLQVSDLAAGPDGALYFTTGGRSTQAGLYRIVAESPAPAAPPSSNVKRRERRAIATSADEAKLIEALESDDRFLRHTARFNLERRGDLNLVVPKPSERAWRALWLAEARTAQADPTAPLEPLDVVSTRLLSISHGLEGEELGWYLRSLSVLFQRHPNLDPSRRKAWLTRLAPRFPTGDVILDRELASLLVFLEDPGFVPQAIERLEQVDLTEAFYYAFLLRDVRFGWTDELRAAYFRFLNRATLELQGGHDVPILLSNVRRAAVSHLTSEEKQRLGPLLIPPSIEDGVSVEAREFVRDWTLDELRALLPRLEEERDPVRGTEVYREASCATCHVFRGIGMHRAPELSTAGARFSAEDLLESIVAPSRVISEPYRTTVFELEDGTMEVGHIRREGPAGVLLIRDSPPYDSVFLRADEIVDRFEHQLSSMPQGLLNTHGEQDILDLLALLLSEP